MYSGTAILYHKFISEFKLSLFKNSNEVFSGCNDHFCVRILYWDINTNITKKILSRDSVQISVYILVRLDRIWVVNILFF